MNKKAMQFIGRVTQRKLDLLPKLVKMLDTVHMEGAGMHYEEIHNLLTECDKIDKSLRKPWQSLAKPLAKPVTEK